MKYYMATDDNNKKQVHSLVKKLRTKGFYCVNEWKAMSQTSDRGIEVQTGNFEEKEIESADFILVFLTAGKGSLHSIGYALALNKKMIVYSPEKDHYHLGKKSIFHNLPNVYICSGTLYKLEKMIHALFTEQFEKRDSFQMSNR